MAVMPDFLPFAATGGIAVAVVVAVYFLRGNSQPAPPGIVRLTDTSEAGITLEIERTSEEPETETPTEELPGIETEEPSILETAEAIIAETSEPVAEHSTVESPQTEPPVQTTAEPPAVAVTPVTSESNEQATTEIVPETSEPKVPANPNLSPSTRTERLRSTSRIPKVPNRPTCGRTGTTFPRRKTAGWSAG